MSHDKCLNGLSNGHKFCGTCGKRLYSQNKTGFCRAHYREGKSSEPFLSRAWTVVRKEVLDEWNGEKT